MIEQNYRIEAFAVLLNEDCLMSRYYPLIPYKDALIDALKAKGCETKRDCAMLPDEELRGMGLSDGQMIALFRHFLTCYDLNESKMRAIWSCACDDATKARLSALARLPGVRLVRALLYDDSGYTSPEKIAQASAEDIIEAAKKVIAERQLACVPPLPKEARTHIAVAKALTEYAAD